MYIITEKQNLQSHREGRSFHGSLDDAKKDALENQLFHGTVLTIEEDGVLVSSCKDEETWQDMD